MTYWNYGLPYQPLNENQPPRRLIPFDRLKLIAIVVGFTVMVSVLGFGITLIVVSKTKSRHLGLEAISMATATTTKRPLSRPTPSGIEHNIKISSDTADVLKIKSLSHFTVIKD